MMKKSLKHLLFFPVLLFAAGIVFSQTASDAAFTLIQQIGLESPQGVQYDPNFDRFVMVIPSGQLVLADAISRTIQHTLYENGRYSGYQFSHDGRWLAVALEQTVEIWNTETGERDLELQPTVALGFSSRLQFSDDDTLLLFIAIVPAPDDIRRSETDTTLAPWLWDLEAERRNRTGILPEQRRAQPFFDLRTDLLLAPNNKMIAALPRSVAVYNITSETYETTANIETNRFEFDPIDIWYSLRGEHAYFRSLDGNSLFQINTQTGLSHLIPVGRELFPHEIAAQEGLELSDGAQIIGDSVTQQTNSFLRLLLSDRYHPNESPLTVMLLDMLDPITLGEGQMGFLIYEFNEATGRGVIDFVRPEDVLQMTLNPARSHVAVRRASGERVVEIYELATGNLEVSFVPGAFYISANDVFSYNSTGGELLVGWARYDAATGAMLSEEPRYLPGFDNFVFSDDGTSIITLNGEVWREWDIETGQPIRTETIRLNGEFIQVSPDSRRYLTRIPFDGEIIEEPVEGEETTEPENEGELFDNSDPDAVALLQAAEIPSLKIAPGNGVEVFDITTGERQQILFTHLPNRGIQQVVASPDWEHFLVVYGSNPYSPYYPGNEVAIYSLDDGLVWFYAGDDLPAAANRRYGWSDNHTAFVLSAGRGASDQPQRIYGLAYEPSGLPTCLVEAFPDDWIQWTDLWERFHARLRSDALGRLTQHLCAAQPETIKAVEEIFFPSPTPTRPPVIPTSSRIAGLPACLSSVFPGQAAAYAPQWRQMTEGLDAEAIAELEEILCTGLRDGIDLPAPSVMNSGSTGLQVVTIDVVTGERAVGSFVPLTIPEPRPLSPVLAEFIQMFGYEPQQAVLSNDAQMLAVRTFNNHVEVYRLTRPYQTYIDSLAATAQAAQESLPVQVALAVTPTAPYIPLGGPRPTLTPTITPTAPLMPQATVTYAEQNEVIELCEHPQIYHVYSPPPDYVPDGRLLTAHDESGIIQVYDPASGRRWLGEGLVDAQNGMLSPDQEWLLRSQPEIVVSRADGSHPTVLYTAQEQPVFPQELFWFDSDTVEYAYNGYLPDISTQTFTLRRQFDVETGELSAPFTATPSPRVNQLSTSVVSRQPEEGSLAVLSVGFNAGYVPGWKYYLYDSATEQLQYFARVSDGNQLQIIWNPRGTALYYRFANLPEWYVYDPAADEHRILGNLPDGQWSRDGRYKVQWSLPSYEEVLTRLENEMPIPKLSIWDSETGLTRRYCIPGTGDASLYADLFWSPDNRYLAFSLVLPQDAIGEVYRPRTLILDTQTGSITELSVDVSRIIVWTES